MQDVPKIDKAVLTEEVRMVKQKLLEVQDANYTVRTSRIAKGELLAPQGTVFLKVELKRSKYKYRNHMLILTSTTHEVRKLIAQNLVDSLIKKFEIC